MANFNEKINCGIEYILNSQGFRLYKSGTIKEFARMIHDDLYLRTNTYRLFIQYKTTHRAKKIAGRCFLWDNSHGDHMADPGNGIELRSLNDASKDDCEGFGNPRFDDVSAAIFISDEAKATGAAQLVAETAPESTNDEETTKHTAQGVFVYGDVQIDANDISKDKKHVLCTVSLCGSMVSFFRIPAEVFEHFFGLIPRKRKKPVQSETKSKCEQAVELMAVDLINDAKRKIESCKNLLDTNACQLERASDAIKLALMDIDDQKCELDDMLAKLNDTLRKLK